MPPASISCYDDHRGLHSFPTRRSSDLLPPGQTGFPDRVTLGVQAQQLAELAEQLVVHGQTDGAGGKKRSEEHTSELQSHSDLVCRLVLEKKKNKVRLREHQRKQEELLH